MTTIELNGHRIFYRTFGAHDLPAFLLLHGLYGDSGSVVPLAERFADRFHVIAPDAIGHGRSDRPADFTLEDQGRMLVSLIGSLGYDSAAMMGISMGSYLAAQAAVLEPARISRLVLVVGKAHGLTSSSVAYAQRMGFDIAGATPEELMEFMAAAVWSPDTTPARRAELFAGMADFVDPEVVLDAGEQAAVERSLAGFDLRPSLSRITAPTLVVSGRSDGLNPPEVGEELARHIPDSRFEVYEHSGHALPWEEGDRLVAEVTEFLTAS
jgi:3-oxoadipate enol-lactonase